MTLLELLALKDAVKRPKIVCLCGSIRRAADAFDKANLEETIAGNIVLSVGTTKVDDAELFHNDALEHTKKQLDILHLWKIELADEVIILNKNGYIGESTRRELEYAQRLQKTIRWFEQPSDTA